MIKNFKSPLRYPGSKASIAELITRIAVAEKLDGIPVYEPYAGSAAISVAMIASGISSKAFISELDPLLYAFWKTTFTNPKKLIKRIESAEITLKNWHFLRPLLDLNAPDENQLDLLGFAALFFNRTNFSGVLHSGPIGGQTQDSDYSIDCRFNREELIGRIELLATLGPKFDVKYSDATEIISSQKSKKSVFFYIDPPYFLQGKKLYRYSYRLSNHIAIANLLQKAKFPWILSYDKHDVIENLYEGFHNVYQEFKYSSRVAKTESELLISNFEIKHAGAHKLKISA